MIFFMNFEAHRCLWGLFTRYLYLMVCEGMVKEGPVSPNFSEVGHIFHLIINYIIIVYVYEF